MKNKSTAQKVHVVLAIIGLFFVILFTLQNAEIVIVRFMFWKLEMSRVILIFVVLLIGFLLGYMTRSINKSVR